MVEGPRRDIDELARELGLGPPPGCLPFLSRTAYEPWFDRVDPLWLGFGSNPAYAWHGSTRTEWEPIWHPYGPRWQSRKVPERTVAIDHVRWRKPGGRVERVAGALIAWHVLTSQQLSAFTSIDRRGVLRTLDAMMGAGLVERSKMVARYSAGSAMPYLWRLRLESAEYRAWFKSLDADQRHLLTLGVENGSGGHDRHDVVTAEIALRAAEVMPKLQIVFGDRAAGAKQLLRGGPKVRTRGDAVVVRDDGLRIVLEITTQPTIPDVRRKMVQWGRLLGERGGPAETGVVVIFVSAQYSGGGVELLQRSFSRSMTVEGLGGETIAPPEVLRAARASIFVAHWQDWFPASWCISECFGALEAYYSPSDGTFFPVRVADPGPGGVPFRPARSADWGQDRRNRELLPGVPRWIEGPVVWAAEGESAS